ncbi:hypothetical protein G3N95_30590 [Paraburkholderia sp. Tr-20389]|nr:hypothetical protein [Paraburkholderia sp. Tr-20389]
MSDVFRVFRARRPGAQSAAILSHVSGALSSLHGEVDQNSLPGGRANGETNGKQNGKEKGPGVSVRAFFSSNLVGSTGIEPVTPAV